MSRRVLAATTSGPAARCARRGGRGACRVVAVSLVAALAAACGPGDAGSRLVLGKSAIPIECSDGREPEFAPPGPLGGEYYGFHQAAFTRCVFAVDVPEHSRFLFRVSVHPVDYLKGRSARAWIYRVGAEQEHALFVHDLGGKTPVYQGSIELPPGPLRLSLQSAAAADYRGTGAVTWTDLEIVSRAVDPGPAWIVAAETALAPWLAANAPLARAGERRRLVVIGMDGGSWRLVRTLIEDGAMPALAALRARGRWGVLRSTVIPSSAMSWAALGTGANPGKTGVFTSGAPSASWPPFWDLVQERGLASLLVAVPGARLEPDGPGLRVSDSADRSWVRPPELAPLLARAGYQPRPVAMLSAKRMIDQMNLRADVVSALLRGTDWDLAFFVFRHTDTIARAFGLYTSEWERVYRAFDANLAKVLRSVDERTTVLLVSSHGWSYFDRSIDLNAWLGKQRLPGWRAGAPEAGNSAMLSYGHPFRHEARPPELRDLEARLAQLRDPDTRQPAIHAIRRVADVFPGRFEDAAPGQLVVEAGADYFLAIREPNPESQSPRIFRGSADGESREGIYLLAGPGVGAGEGPERSIYDVAPSVLRFFGIEPPAGLDGTALPEIAPRPPATGR